ncbi:MAG: hypothetical protein WA932_02660 [Nitrososphaeraceae archaeon]
MTSSPPSPLPSSLSPTFLSNPSPLFITSSPPLPPPNSLSPELG